MIEDRSTSGLGIHTSKSVPVGTRVNVKFGNRTVAAVVRRCIKVPLGFTIGVSFEQEGVSSLQNPAESEEQA
jgi:hypothetical protein